MEALPNRCPSHPESQKEFFCQECKTIFCYICCKNDKKHKQSISSLSETLLDNYEFLSYLGGGSYGKVFKVRSLNDGLEHALKVIEGVDDEVYTLAKKESQFLCSLNHKNIVKYSSSFRIKDEKLFIILMELAEESLLDKIPSMTQELAFEYLKQICEGLAYLHMKLGVMHRDLKPGNILLKGDIVKICDLGEAKTMKNTHTKLSNPESFYGTEVYLAPEVLLGKDYGFKADIWAIGIIFHKMLTNSIHPFSSSSNKEKDALKKNIINNQIKISQNIKNPLYLDILKGFFVLNYFKNKHDLL